MSTSRKILIRLTAIAFITGSCWYMFQTVHADWKAVSEFSWRLSPLPLILSVMLLIVSSLLSIKSAHVLWVGLGGHISFRRFLRIFCVAQLGRYLPGKLWSLAGFAVLLEREGSRRLAAVALPIILQVVMIAVFVVLASILSGPELLTRTSGQGRLFFIIFMGILLILLGWLPCGLRCLKMPVPLLGGRIDSLSWPYDAHLKAVGLLVAGGLMLAAAFLFFVMSCITVPRSQVFFIGGSIIVAHVFSWLILIAPGGIGVREGALALVLAAVLPAGVGVFVAVSSRVWATLGELALLACALFAGRAKQTDALESSAAERTGVP